MEKKALGRGLSALISSSRRVEEVLRKEVPLEPKRAGAEGVAFSATDHEGAQTREKNIFFVPLAHLVPNRFQPRTSFDEDQLKELAASIKEKGVLAPILVRHTSGNQYEIIAGERRFRAAQFLKLERVPVVVRDVDDSEALILSIVENIQRQELNPMEEARAFQRLQKEFSLTQEQVSQAVSKDRSTVANILRLLNLPPEVQKAISSGHLSLGHGKALLGLESVAQQIKLTQLVLSNSLSVRELENYILSNRLAAAQQKRRTLKDKDPYVNDLEKQLQHALGTKVKIFVGKKRGRIQIEYYSTDDRERILRALLKK
jgi:ParB family chromosome partitioning protein